MAEGFGLILRDMFFRRLNGLFFFGLSLVVLGFAEENLWKSDQGKVRFMSDAPLEIIAAESQSLRGIINPLTKSFSFSMRINSFEGFNSAIQQVHFFENYMEEKKYPSASFEGKFIEDISFDRPGNYTVRAKGNLNIHGVVKERIIKGTVQITNSSARLQAQFFVLLSDHGITIPKIVMQKIAEDIEVTIDIGFRRDKAS